ncbi:hypothetical protein [Chitinophaga arvensicola]|uniref:Uncharacterized protein n=1 Tax=Chitinophaga arvensicola TaxID=29529 RepID=A0A1I0SBI5_9BACT|nr:hypothetical protein [Chitinophaga arvensicola]SEW54023.1 hypothetical protein SAMN04488122_5857 [Chitinophaga arvensicola]
MKLSPRLNKWLKILGALLLFRIVLGLLLYYLVEHKFVKIIQYIVSKESNDSYKFDADAIDFSLWKRNIIIKNARLVGKDTVHVSAHYDVAIPRVYLSIQSWRALILHKKLLVDSLSVIDPSLLIHEHVARGPRTDSFQLSSVVDHLEQALQYVNARIVHLQNGSLVYSKVNGPPPLRVDHFNFSIVNFSKVTHTDNHILGSDDVDFSFDNQHWILPDGRNTISFKRLHFSGKNQFFQLDSCTISSAATATKGEMSLSADQFYFNARHLPAIYMREELLIDTLVCIRPVLKLPGRKLSHTDKKVALDSLPNTLFKRMNFRYIEVRDGELLLRGNVSTGTTKRTNLNIYNLTIAHDTTPAITTDSIALRLNKIKFYSLDSMFQLSVDEFVLQRNDVIFNQVEYGPTPRNHSGKGLTFTAPSLRLNNVSLEDLLRKRLKATSAELYQPGIHFLTKAKTPVKGRMPIDSTRIKMPAFYQTLHGLSQTIQVNTFRIIEGNINFTSTGKTPVTLQVKNMNTDILLHNFLMSDSLVDIKHSMPNLHIEQMNVLSDKAGITVNNYAFDGTHRHNKAASLTVSLSNGTRMAANDLYWEVFDWDVYQESKDIQVDVLRIGALKIQAQSGGTKKTGPPKDLPVIRVAQLDVGSIQFSSEGADQHSSFNADKIALRNVRTRQHFITWGTATGQFSNIRHHSPGTDVSIAAVQLNTSGLTTITAADATLHNAEGYTKIKLPALQLQTALHSTDMSQLLVQSLNTAHPQIEIFRTGHHTAKKKAAPLQATLQKLAVSDAAILYTQLNGADTTRLQTTAQLEGSGIALHTGSPQLLHYQQLHLDLSALSFHHTGTQLEAPQLSVQLQKGQLHQDKNQQLSLRSGVVVNWQDIQLALHHGDTLDLVLQRLSGMFKDAGFYWQKAHKIAWSPFVGNTSIHQGGFYYRNKQLHAQAENVALDPATRTFYLHQFEVTPNLSAAETFRTAPWQKDYITVKGALLEISGMDIPDDSTIAIRRITIDSTLLTTARDKRIPFQHGIEKLMPSKLIGTLPVALHADSIIVRQSAVTVNESSRATNKWSAVPITGINAVITHFGNTYGKEDSLQVQASGRLLGNPIRYFSYHESYGDSLSGFTAQSYLAPMDLKDFNQVAIPMAAVKVRRGVADTIFSQWSGNKYATLGTMNFYYRNLNIQVLNKKDSTRMGFMAHLKTMLANALLRNNNLRPTRMFFERDREKFIFNYWVKAETSGIITAVGVKKDKKYLKKYNKVAKKYGLPKK